MQRQIKTNTKNANIMKKALIIVALALSVLSCSGQGKNIGQEAIKGKTATIKTNNNNKQKTHFRELYTYLVARGGVEPSTYRV